MAKSYEATTNYSSKSYSKDSTITVGDTNTEAFTEFVKESLSVYNSKTKENDDEDPSEEPH